ncbi:hypothetical protein K458DRAFT_425272 [Lentithecium fluviatile CBS 122367]|uniref:Uncharacterized protein n=1 Tax=Lentithecium fluviatile CBS 122367 TaxID=1168545 RepID=A0A6G1IBY4_9PLEO|nr:hypothetical protein K458DRAFT_425272 [Lentithecium fluviatile CBS 122367]
MTSDSNSHSNVEEDEEFWKRWRSNTYERKLVKPMKKPLTAPLDLAVSDSDVEKLKAGFRPQSQDDKWAWLIEDENGNISIHIIRHFVQEEVYILHIAPKSSNDNGASAKIHSITWEGDMNGIQNDAEQAKKNVVILARIILKCDFETLPHYAPGTV